MRRDRKGEGKYGEEERKEREGRERAERARLEYLYRGPEFLVTPLMGEEGNYASTGFPQVRAC